MGAGFLICNPTILLPQTWAEMLTFGTEKRIGHDSYEFFGTLYENRMTAWLSGVPWYFYYVFALLKSPAATLLFFIIGLPMMFRRKLGDGRYFVLLWAFMWLLPFTVLGGKFTRYFTVAEPLLLIIAAVGITGVSDWFYSKIGKGLPMALPIAVVTASLWATGSAAPHYRLYLNVFGAGRVETVFPHDEFYDASTAEIAELIAATADPNAAVANETPALFEHYLQKAGRGDLRSVSLSDEAAVRSLITGDLVVIAKGRRYRSNSAYLEFLKATTPAAVTEIAGVESAKIYMLDERTAKGLNSLTQ
jgi:hypothetical protein